MNMSDAISETVIEAPQNKFLDRAGLRGFPWVPAIVLYTISYGWFWSVRNSNWSDDWDEFMFKELTEFDYNSFGFAPWKRLLYPLFDFVGPTGIRLLVFVCFFLSAVFFFGIIKKIKIIEPRDHKFAVLLFLILPFNSVRVASYVFYFTTSYLYFFAGWYLVVNFRTTKTRLISFLLFFLSFQMFTLTVFFVLPIAHLLMLEVRDGGKKIYQCLRSNSLFLLLPILYWVSRSIFFPSDREYHSITRNKIDGFFKFSALFLLVIVILFLVLRWSKQVFRRPILLISLGLIAAYIAYVPYLLYGLVGYGFKAPVNYLVIMLGRSDWYSRHHILQPFGFSLLLIGIIGILPNFMKGIAPHLISSILIISVIFNLGFGFEYFVDYKKQMEVVRELKVDENLNLGNEVEVIDQTQFLNARQRSYRDRDWLGLVALAKGVESTEKLSVRRECAVNSESVLVLISGPDTHWQALKNWVIDGDMGFKVTVDDTPGACKPEMVTNQQASGAIPILFYFTGAKN